MDRIKIEDLEKVLQRELTEDDIEMIERLNRIIDNLEDMQHWIDKNGLGDKYDNKGS